LLDRLIDVVMQGGVEGQRPRVREVWWREERRSRGPIAICGRLVE
jgi:hypothetical protein